MGRRSSHRVRVGPHAAASPAVRGFDAGLLPTPVSTRQTSASQAGKGSGGARTRMEAARSGDAWRKRVRVRESRWRVVRVPRARVAQLTKTASTGRAPRQSVSGLHLGASTGHPVHRAGPPGGPDAHQGCARGAQDRSSCQSELLEHFLLCPTDSNSIGDHSNQSTTLFDKKSVDLSTSRLSKSGGSVAVPGTVPCGLLRLGEPPSNILRKPVSQSDTEYHNLWTSSVTSSCIGTLVTGIP
eukprot:4589075-Prymnesium_polylepis.3